MGITSPFFFVPVSIDFLKNFLYKGKFSPFIFPFLIPRKSYEEILKNFSRYLKVASKKYFDSIFFCYGDSGAKDWLLIETVAIAV